MAAVAGSSTRPGLKEIGKRELFDSLFHENYSGQPLVLFCPGKNRSIQEREAVKDGVYKTLRLLKEVPRFTVVFCDPIPGGDTLYVGPNGSGGLKFYSEY